MWIAVLLNVMNDTHISISKPMVMHIAHCKIMSLYLFEGHGMIWLIDCWYMHPFRELNQNFLPSNLLVVHLCQSH